MIAVQLCSKGERYASVALAGFVLVLFNCFAWLGNHR